MDIKIVTTFESANDFLHDAEQNQSNTQELWRKHMIEPYWADIAKWAPFDQSFKQPPCVENLTALKEQLELLASLSLDELKRTFQRIAEELPAADDPVTVFLYPACDNDKTLKEKQNGVVGTVVFGNVIIRINSLAKDFLKWIPFVFAHEYHHNVWGYRHFVLNGGENSDGSFLEYMVTEGQADLFAESLFPELVPQWNRPYDNATETRLWERMKPVLSSTDHEIHAKYMFGNQNEGLPWCMGYSFGRKIVSAYLKEHAGLSFSALIDVPAKQFLRVD